MKHEQNIIIPALKKPPRILVVEARFYEDIADQLFDGACEVLTKANATIERVHVGGALEIPPCIALAMRSNKYDAYIALGCIIRGETYHFEIVCNESARGIMDLGLQGALIGNGILTVETMAQAAERADKSRLNKGAGAALAALQLLAVQEKMSKIA